MNVANAARVVVIAGACLAAVGSATSNTNPTTATDPNLPQTTGGGDASTPPPARQMEAARAMGVWKSTFGAVKIEPDQAHGGLQQGSVQGVWIYQRQGQEVVGFFSGNLRGNVLQFHWQEPATPPLTGDGYLVFDPSGRQYSGRWWSERHDRVGDWNGWRLDAAKHGPAQQAPEPYNGQGQPEQGGEQQGYPQPPPQTQRQPQPYPAQQPPQQAPYQPQPYPAPQQGYPQQQPPQPYPAQPAQQPAPPPQRGYY